MVPVSSGSCASCATAVAASSSCHPWPTQSLPIFLVLSHHLAITCSCHTRGRLAKTSASSSSSAVARSAPACTSFSMSKTSLRATAQRALTARSVS
eukprot:1909290-Prymnesium_polylepis.1